MRGMTNTNGQTMRAAVVTHYGAPEVVVVREVPRPTPAAGEVLIRVRATTVSSGDARMRARRVPAGMSLLVRLAIGWSGPRQPVLGMEFSGEVDRVGEGVTRFRPGDAVVGFVSDAGGTHAEYLCVREDARVIPKPEGLSWEESAALFFGGNTALHFLQHEAKVQPGESVLVLGASGAVGVAAVQIARSLGAKVTAVCSAANADLVRGLGATAVMDYHTEDFTRGEAKWDVIMDCVGATDYARSARVLAPGGRLLRLVCGLWGQLAAPFQGRLAGHRVIAGVAEERIEDVRALGEMARDGRYRAVIDASFPLSRITDAHARVDGGHKRGSVVVTVG